MRRSVRGGVCWLSLALAASVVLGVVPALAQTGATEDPEGVAVEQRADPGNDERAVEPRAVAENSLDVVYVSYQGSDADGNGSEESPLASLDKAVLAVKNGGTVYVMTDIEAHALALVSHKDITIDGTGHTVTRAAGFTATNDEGRGGYQPAMIEVANGSELTLVNITLDDAFRAEASSFELADTANKENRDKVHDGIIASYGDGRSTIVLGEGTTLKNFGGLAAVYITGLDGEGATLVMRSGSKICDDSTGSRKGGYAAIFNHGGTVTAEEGSSIEAIDGRAIYADNGGVTTFSGAIKNITSNEVMKNAVAGAANSDFAGIAFYGPDHTSFTLGKGGVIADIKSHDKSAADVVLYLGVADFVMEAGSEMYDIQACGIAVMNGATVDIAGSVHDCSTGTVPFRMRNDSSSFYLHEGGELTNISTSDPGIIYMNMGRPTIEIAGTIDTCNKPALYISNNGPRKDGTVTVTETGVITNITGDAIKASDPSAVTIRGTVTNCSGYAVEYNPKGTGSLLKIEESAHIAGNHNGGAQIKVAGSLSATDATEHAEIAPGAIEGNTTIDLTPFDVTLDADHAAIQLGNANGATATAIKEAMAAEHSDWTVIGSSALWLQPSDGSVHFTASRPYSVKNTGLFAAYVPLDGDGTPNGDVELVEIENGSVIDVTLEGLTPGQSYALMFVNNDEYTLAPDDVTIYIGGGQGDEEYDDGGFPAVTMYNSVDEIQEMTIDGEPVAEGNGATFESALMDLIDVTYLDESGNPVDSDEEPGEYTVVLSWRDSPAPAVRINGNEVNSELKSGTLIVRHTADIEGATEGTTTHELLTDEPTEPVTHAEAIANKLLGILGPTFYTNDDENREIDAEGIQLLDDSLLTDLGDGRQELMEQKAADYLGNPGEGQAWRCDFHYLDLVDAYNGNAWVSASYGTTIYLPYPEGVTKDNAESLAVQVVHYPGLHREYGIAGQAEVEEALDACELETMDVEFTDEGIKFETERAGFSPFAIVWKTEARTITASADEGSTVTPAGTFIVSVEEGKTFSVEAKDGYAIADVTLNGISVLDQVRDGLLTVPASDEDQSLVVMSRSTLHEHVWSDWKCDGESHWKVCETCGAVSERAEHTYGDWQQTSEATGTDRGQWVRTCTVCGYEQHGTTPVTEPDDSGIPETGDKTPTMLVGVLATCGVTLSAGVVFHRRRRDG